jgi:hypothetical protein
MRKPHDFQERELELENSTYKQLAKGRQRDVGGREV